MTLKTSPVQRAEIVRRVLDGEDIRRVAKAYGIGVVRVGQLMHAAGYRRVWRWEATPHACGGALTSTKAPSTDDDALRRALAEEDRDV